MGLATGRCSSDLSGGPCPAAIHSACSQRRKAQKRGRRQKGKKVRYDIITQSPTYFLDGARIIERVIYLSDWRPSDLLETYYLT